MNSKNFNNMTALNDDPCYKDTQFKENMSALYYNIPGFEVDRVQNSTRNQYFESLDNLAMYEYNKDSFFKNVDSESCLFEGKCGNVITNSGCRADKQANTSKFVYPFQGYRYPDESNIDTYSRLVNSAITHDKTSSRGVSIDRFIPLLKAVKDEVQNVEHLIPKYWVRGGMDTRSVIRNIDYLKSCGVARH